MTKVLTITGVPNSGMVQLIPKDNEFSMITEGAEGFIGYVQDKDFMVEKVFFLPYGKQSVPNPKNFDIVVNYICDTDSSSLALEKAEYLCDATSTPVINHPQDIAQTTRDNIYTLLKEPMEGLIVPRVFRFTPLGLQDVIDTIEKENINYPFLMRPAGSHTGKGLVKIDESAQLPTLERFAFDGSDYYITEFYDYQSVDSLYRKYRTFVVDHEIFPRHVIVSESWNIHSGSRVDLMNEEKYKKEEEVFIDTFDISRYVPLSKIIEKIKLDYFAIDFGIDKEGNIVIFEINSCTKLHHGANPPENVQKIITAVKNMIINRISTDKKD